MINDDTIVALATPPGRGAIAVVRVSGPRAHEIVGALVRPWPIVPRSARLVTAVDAAGAAIDRPVVTVYEAPRSYTGEDVVEIATHGGALVPASIVAALVEAGAREALPGEFTRRAVLNGKMDMAQAEAVADLIDAGSAAMQRAALTQLDGGLSRRVAALREALLGLEALIAYDIDFPEEDDGPIARARITESADRARENLRALLATADLGEIVRAGAVVVIAGPPNAGKSSLFNALLGQSRALVTAIPGTTRDAIEAVIEPAGAPFPLRLVDTAGLRESEDVVEKLGIEVSLRYLSGAHIVLACAETRESLQTTVEVIRAHTKAPVIPVRTKADLADETTSSGRHLLSPLSSLLSSAPEERSVSADTGIGLRELLALTIATIQSQNGGGSVAPDTPIITRARHRTALETAAAELAHFQEAWTTAQVPAVIAAVHLRSAILALDEIIGAVDIDDVLDRLFRDFCIGK